MAELFIHIGPMKTGTTAIQQYFWANRQAYREVGLLYPETGIFGVSRSLYGPRHLRLAKKFVPARWEALAAEIEESGCQKVLISAERFSFDTRALLSARQAAAKYAPKVVIFVRNEKYLVPSRYLQRIKSRSIRAQKGQTMVIEPFESFWSDVKDELTYARLVEVIAATYGKENLVFVPYRNQPDFNAINALCQAIGVPVLGDTSAIRSNPSISPFVANWAVAGFKFGRFGLRAAMTFAEWAERRFPEWCRKGIKGYDESRILGYLRDENADTLAAFPAFAEAYRRAHE